MTYFEQKILDFCVKHEDKYVYYVVNLLYNDNEEVPRLILISIFCENCHIFIIVPNVLINASDTIDYKEIKKK